VIDEEKRTKRFGLFMCWARPPSLSLSQRCCLRDLATVALSDLLPYPLLKRVRSRSHPSTAKMERPVAAQVDESGEPYGSELPADHHKE